MELIILSLLILLNGFFSLSEIALVSSKRSRIEKLRSDGNKGAKTAIRLMNDSENFLSAIQVGITLIGIITGVYGGINIADDITPFFTQISLTQPYAAQIALLLTILVITYVSIVIGELVPKTIAISNPENIAVKIAPFIHFFSTLFYPVVVLLSASTAFINKMLGIRPRTEHLTESELRHMIKIASHEGVIEKEQNIIHEKVFYFSDKKAKHLMTHRTDVEWIDIDKDLEEIKFGLSEINHSKVVCCQGNLDNFLGVMYLKDYYRSLAKQQPLQLTELILKPLIVPENSDATKVLNLLKAKNGHLCFVVNEYGGFEGIITLHDIMEHLVGQIANEGEIYEPDLFIREDQSILVNGDATVETLSEIISDFSVDFEQVEYATVAGFVFNKLNKIPQIGDHFNFMGYRFEIVDLDGRKIDKILLIKL